MRLAPFASTVRYTSKDIAALSSSSQVAECKTEFERLVTDISVQFVNLPLAQLDEAVRSALGQFARLFEVDRCHFVRILPDGTLKEAVPWGSPVFPALDSLAALTERLPWTLSRAIAGEIVCFSRLDDISTAVDRATYREMGTKSAVAAPLAIEGRLAGLVVFNMVRGECSWGQRTVDRMRLAATAFVNVVVRCACDESLRRARADVDRLPAQPGDDHVLLARRWDELPVERTIVGQTPALRRALEQVQQVAGTDTTVLLLGETGVGKEVFAAHVHRLSARRGRAMIRVNCSAIPATLIESELFGREKGAFTGALSRQVGRFELADHSTIFLDEIGDLSLDVQVKLLRVLEEREIERLGSSRSIRVDTRIIAATHRNLEQRVADGRFREDLFYRLNVFPIRVPPLRERVEDIPLLVWRFVGEFSKSLGKRIDSIPVQTMEALMRHPWPGNIRELRNSVERAMIVATSQILTVALPPMSSTSSELSERLVDVEKAHIRKVLEAAGWRVRGAGFAADRLGLKATTLEARMAKHGLKRQKP